MDFGAVNPLRVGPSMGEFWLCIVILFFHYGYWTPFSDVYFALHSIVANWSHPGVFI